MKYIFSNRRWSVLDDNYGGNAGNIAFGSAGMTNGHGHKLPHHGH